VRLDALVVEQDEEAGEEPADDWFFTCEGPDSRVVLISAGSKTPVSAVPNA
jgi:hypothetical protein